MSDCLSQSDADRLISMDKKFPGEMLSYPVNGGKISFEIRSLDDDECFIIDVNPSKMTLNKVTHQERYRKSIVLVRFDMNSTSHINPDGERISGNHVHVYREGYGDSFAIELPECFDISTKYNALISFLRYCNVCEPKKIVRKDLFDE